MALFAEATRAYGPRVRKATRRGTKGSAPGRGGEVHVVLRDDEVEGPLRRWAGYSSVDRTGAFLQKSPPADTNGGEVGRNRRGDGGEVIGDSSLTRMGRGAHLRGQEYPNDCPLVQASRVSTMCCILRRERWASGQVVGVARDGGEAIEVFDAVGKLHAANEVAKMKARPMAQGEKKGGKRTRLGSGRSDMTAMILRYRGAEGHREGVGSRCPSHLRLGCRGGGDEEQERGGGERCSGEREWRGFAHSKSIDYEEKPRMDEREKMKGTYPHKS
ncbi:hypothetical protein B0H13DRAFT_1864102 [Mycena leptocephala]|nr:hypothetical protein B0H13DRAFT_1864102 [Mycena leptocephala]